MAPVTGGVTVEVTRKSFASPDGTQRPVLRDVAFRLEPGEFVALVGPSGCGKTTLLNIIAGLDTGFTGAVRLGGARLGYVFQQPRLLPWRTVYENIALVLPGRPSRAAIDRLLDEVGLAEARDLYPQRLSLGMARRVALARGLAIEPQLLLMDEPYTSLDEATADRLRALLLTLWQSRRMNVLLVTHDAREAIALADRILVLSDAPGRLLREVPITLPREHRAEPAVVDAIRAALAGRPQPAVTSASRGRR